MRIRTFLLTALGLMVLVLSACGVQTGQTEGVLKVAVIAPFSGDFELWGQSTRNGVVLAIESWNQRGGVLENVVQAVLLDSKCDYETAREVAQEAVDEHNVQFIIGAVCADAAEGVAQVAMEQGVLQISPTSVDPELTLDNAGNVRWLVFRVPFIDPDQGAVAAKFALDTLGVESVGILHAENSPYGLALADAFAAAFKAGGGEVVVRRTYNQDAEVFYDVLADVRDANPQMLYFPGYYNVVNRLAFQARTFGLLQGIIGSDGWDSPELDLTTLDGSYFTAHYFAGESRPEVSDWTQRYVARYIVPPDVVATLGYDAANILLAAIQEAGTTGPNQVADTMMSMTFEAVTGEMTFDATHNPVKGVLVLRVLNGQVVYVDRLIP